MEKIYKIGDFSKFSHISISTLRLYDKLDLLKPIYIDKETQYRYYSVSQNSRLDLINYMKELNMQLSEIKDILDSNDPKIIEATLIRKKKQVKDEIKEKEHTLNAISRAIESIERFRVAPKKGMITIEYIPHRYIYFMPTKTNFYDYGIEEYEKILSNLKQNMIDNKLPIEYYCNAGTIMNKEDFLNQNYFSNEIFVFVDEDFPLSKNVKRIESGMYACIYLDNFDEEKKYAKTLLDYIKDNKYKISGNYICEVLTEFNISNSIKRSMYLKLQIPLTF